MKFLGITETQVKEQLEIFRKSSYFISLHRPCTVGDGIQTVMPEEKEKYLQIQQQAADAGRFLKFVPASGSASRMFQALFQILNEPHAIEHEKLLKRANKGDAVARDFLQFIDDIERFAFFEQLKGKVAQDGLILTTLIGERQFQEVLEYLLTEKGLQYGSLPKGLLKFHRYPSENRTAFEEHLVEASHYVRDKNGVCRLHFTVSPEHEKRFQQFLENVRTRYEKHYGISFEVGFSTQKPSTDTIAADLSNRPFRDEKGRLLFRAGGHGALLDNLNALRGDLVYIKNIDNVVPDDLKEATFLWKRILGGCLVEVQEGVHGHLRQMKDEENSQELLEEVTTFAREKLLVHLPEDFEKWPPNTKGRFLWSQLNRPIRVCGVVPNVGEPGGAPFWAIGKEGRPSLQIVEKAQVNLDLQEQKDIWMSSTHFNPVDLVCALRDYEGKPFDLKSYVDHDAVFISKKSKDGEDLKALEHPGLWNGGMAHWITFFVEVPLVTFNPVKTVNDLLRPEHQPRS
jgi:hypothetical protein